MARHQCRDCQRCTESAMRGCLVAPLRFWVDFARKLFVYPFVEMCPECRHPLRWHRRDARGRFAD